VNFFPNGILAFHTFQVPKSCAGAHVDEKTIQRKRRVVMFLKETISMQKNIKKQLDNVRFCGFYARVYPFRIRGLFS
jgi:hypothetical protein